MKWLIWSILAWASTGTSFLLLRNTGRKVSNSIDLEIIYILTSFVVAGLIAFLILLSLILKNQKVISDMKQFGKTNLIALGFILVLSYLFLKFASNEGGSPAFQIANLNIIISVVGGYIFFNERLNPVELFGILLAIISAAIIGAGKPLYKYLKR